MAAERKSADVSKMLSGVGKRELVKFLQEDPRVRDWLGSGVLMSTSEAAELLEVERGRVWRWVNMDRIQSVAITGATPLFLRADVLALKRELAAGKSKAAA
jgi:excisionase family DNA binding protein